MHLTSTSSISLSPVLFIHTIQSIISNQKRHYSQPLKKMLKDTCAKTLLKVFEENYIASDSERYKHTPQTLSFTFRTCKLSLITIPHCFYCTTCTFTAFYCGL